ncbi:MAG: class I SAM-dependent methyltransferase [Fischerella sp.]|jgi:SAM-dependent methyltransferase|uniref:class I SAM-dependent methyltransferase n=1 Tax=Fischerella sp. TaxID=1191 RepID=UPI001797A4D6|nr:class I SAM-dependent methyltransferase [Fischerella sp.]NWF61048.1 class I SAM-dependent methyltransferase [Fischerella sp.]
MIHTSLDGIKLVDRSIYICKLCKDKKVLHLGATDAPETQDAIINGKFLHTILTNVCKEVVGMDISLEMINFLKETKGISNIHYGNIEVYEDYPKQEFDFIVAGEIIEHLSNPGRALDCLSKIAKPTTKLIITVPNAYSLKGFLRAVARHELIHPDHTLHHSLHTLKTLVERHGFLIESYFSFVNGGTGFMASITNLLLKLYPQLAEGIGVICLPKQENFYS